MQGNQMSIAKKDNCNFTFSSDHNDVDVKKVQSWLCECSWSKAIPISTVEKMIKSSFCVSAFNENNEQIGFSRAITDYCTYAYICDVYVDQDYRGNGIARLMLNIMLEVNDFRKFKHLSLIATPESQSLYESLMFKKTHPDLPHMEICDLNTYVKNRK